MQGMLTLFLPNGELSRFSVFNFGWMSNATNVALFRTTQDGQMQYTTLPWRFEQTK